MNKKIAFIALLLISCQREIEIIEPQIPTPKEQIEELIVKFDPQTHELIKDQLNLGLLATKSMALNEFIDNYAIKSVKRLFIESEEFAERQHREGLDRWYYLQYDASKIQTTKASMALADMPGVEIAETRPKIKITDKDKYFDKQWALYQENGIDINVQTVWDHYTVGDKSVKVAVVDSGVDTNHEDLIVDVKNSKNFIGGNKITACDHGTHVAGVIAAIRNNGIGIAGIAGGDYEKNISPVTIMSCQTGDGEYLDNTSTAIAWAADNGALISQNGWVHSYDRNGDGKLDDTELRIALADKASADEVAAIDYFIKYAGCDNNGNQLPGSLMKGGVVIFAAGNDNIANGAPANYEPVIAVGSIASDGKKSWFSNYGSWVDICAPGSDICSTVPGNAYAYMGGTSMACPQVSGVAALVLAYRGGDGFTNEMLKDCLLKGASNGKIVARNIGPLVDAMGAISYGKVGKPEDIDNGSITINSNSAQITCKVVGDGDGNAAYAVKAFVSKNRSDLENINLQKPANTIKSFTTVTIDSTVGDEVIIDLNGLDFEQEYYYILIAMNYGLVYSEATEIQIFTTGPNTPPVIEPYEDISNLVLKATATKNIKFKIYDIDGHSFKVNFNSGSAADNWINNPNNDYWELVLDATKVKAGKYSAEIVAVDNYKMESRLKVNYTILENQAPVVADKVNNVLMYEKDVTIESSIASCFIDNDGDPLEYSVNNNNPTVAHIIVTDGVLHITPIKAGTCTAEISASDPKGLSVSQTITVIVRPKGEVVSVYPTQVIDYLSIETGAELAKSHLKIMSISGALIKDEDIEASAFEPAKIDMKGFAPGQYIVEVESLGIITRKTIVKL